jgi:Zn-dependent protease
MLPIPPLDGYRILWYLFPSFSIRARLYVAYNPLISLLLIYLLVGTPVARAIISSWRDQLLWFLYIMVSTIVSP